MFSCVMIGVPTNSELSGWLMLGCVITLEKNCTLLNNMNVPSSQLCLSLSNWLMFTAAAALLDFFLSRFFQFKCAEGIGPSDGGSATKLSVSLQIEQKLLVAVVQSIATTIVVFQSAVTTTCKA